MTGARGTERWRFVTRLSGSENHHGYDLRDENGDLIATVMPRDSDGVEGLRYAKRLAAVPEMEATLEGLLRHGISGDDLLVLVAASNCTGAKLAEFKPQAKALNDAIDAARAALAAARKEVEG